MRIEGRFGSGFNLHGGTNVIAVSRRYCRIPKQQTLTIWIVGINGNAGGVRPDVQLGENLLHNLCELVSERVLYVIAAGVLDCIEARLAFLSAHVLKLWNGRCLPKVLPKYGDVDVFGKSRDQAVGFRERRSALEEKSRMPNRQAIKKNVESPSDPEVFFNILFRRAESSRGTEKNVSAILWRCFKEPRKSRIHRAGLAGPSVAMGEIASEEGTVLLGFATRD